MSRNWQDVTAPLPLPRTITNGFNFVDWSRTRLSGLGPKNAQKGWDSFSGLGTRLMACECNCQCAGVQSMPKCILKHCFGYAFCHMASAGDHVGLANTQKPMPNR